MFKPEHDQSMPSDSFHRTLDAALARVRRPKPTSDEDPAVTTWRETLGPQVQAL